MKKVLVIGDHRMNDYGYLCEALNHLTSKLTDFCFCVTAEAGISPMVSRYAKSRGIPTEVLKTQLGCRNFIYRVKESAPEYAVVFLAQKNNNTLDTTIGYLKARNIAVKVRVYESKQLDLEL
jgi:hypothetical protein